MKKRLNWFGNFLAWMLLKIADHHLVHLNEYIEREDIVVVDRGTELTNEFSAMSFIIIDNSFVEKVTSRFKTS